MKRLLARVARVLALAMALAIALVAWDALRWDAARALDPAHGGPLLVLDRHGALLRSIPTPHRPGRERWVTLDGVSTHAVLALLASEDQRFFEHAGVDPWSLARALWLDLKTGAARYGASTLTMQLARMLRPDAIGHDPLGKVRQVATALCIEARLDKRQILEQYLNRAYFGRGAYGVEAAARTYFQKPAASLSVGEATLLMVLPRSPSRYDLVRHRQRALARRDHVLGLLVAQGRLVRDVADRARAEPVPVALASQPFEAHHFVDWVVGELPGEVRDQGGTVVTTLDLALQRTLEHRARDHVAALAEHQVDQAGVLVLDTATGDVLAMVGAAARPDGSALDLNITTRRRYPGSALKPFVYAAAIEQGDFSGTVAYDVYDVPSAYRVVDRPPEERGPVRYREALAGSYNLAAVHVLERAGVERVMNLLTRAGVGELLGAPDDYGLRLALGSTRVRLLDLAAGYGAFVRSGTVVPARGVQRVVRADATRWQPDEPHVTRVLPEQVAYIVMDMMSDPEARRPRFGDDLPFDLPYRVAAKTGTARGFSDTVALAATREWTVAAWTGRFDGRPMEGLSGMRGAAWLARSALLAAARGATLTLPDPPRGVVEVEVCPLSGQRPGPHCPHRKRELAWLDVPAVTCSYHTAVGTRLPRELAPWARRHRPALVSVANDRQVF